MWLPFYKLPVHLMVEIWDYLPIPDRWIITAVSRHFRGVALDSPSLWKYVGVSTGVTQQEFDTLIARTGQCPLHIVVRDQMYTKRINRLNLIAPYAEPPATSSLLAVIPRAVVLNAYVSKSFGNMGQQGQVPHYTLDMDKLIMLMPRLRSLRLLQPMRLPPSQPGQQLTTLPLFGGHTPVLRHFSISGCHLSWFDPIYKNLTYLLIRRPHSYCDFRQFINILHSCPTLEYLGLDNVLGSDDGSQQGVALPLLERLFITDSDPYRVRALLDRLNAPNTIECDFTVPDWSLMSKAPSESSPLRIIGDIREISISSSPQLPYFCFLECRADERRAIRCHFDPGVRTQVPLPEQQARIYEALKRSYIPFEGVQKLTLSGVFSSEMASQLFDLFPSIVTLRARALRLNQMPGHVVVNAFTDILSTGYFSQLQDIEIGPSLTPSFAALSSWLIARSSPESGCVKVKKVAVASHQPLSNASRLKIASIVDNFKWTKAISVTIAPGSTTPWTVPGLLPVQSQMNTTTALGDMDGGWDKDEDVENGVPTAVLKPHSHLYTDDVTLRYCDPSLQTKWDYWALPGQ